MKEANRTITFSPSEIKKFWKRTKRIEGSDCLWWTGNKKETGYGKVRMDGKTWRAHRACYVICHGNIPDGLHILHSCDNPSCVNPDHLSAGTHQENMRQMQIKGRNGNNKIPFFLRRRKPIRNKLSSDDVAKIREAYFIGGKTQMCLAAIFNISQSQISAIVTNKVWKSLASANQENRRA